MKRKELEALINQGEGFHLEFKESVNAKINKELVAFANAKGGRIIVGVDDNGKIVGKKLSNAAKSEIQTIARNCDPSIDIQLEVVEDEPNVFIVNVQAGLNKPYRCTEGFFLREGASSNKRTTSEIYEMFREAGRLSFDDVLLPDVDFDTYFDVEKLDRFLANAKKEKTLSNEETLCNLDAAKMIQGKCVLNNTGLLFFTKEPTKFCKQAVIQCIRFEGDDKSVILDQKHLDKDIFENILDCFAFLQKHLAVGYEFSDTELRRENKWEIPLVVLREAIVNAVIHRDYLEKGAYIQVLVFDSTVSIINYGGLVDGMTVQDLGKKTFRRNPNIADILGKTALSEKMGSGIPRIKKNLEKAGLPAPVFEVDNNVFTVIFGRLKAKVNQNKQLSSKESATKRELFILMYCREPMRREDILSHIELGNNTLNFNRNILPMIEKGWIAMTIIDKPSSKNQKYVITDLGLQILDNTYLNGVRE